MHCSWAPERHSQTVLGTPPELLLQAFPLPPSGWLTTILGSTLERNAWGLRTCLELVALPCVSTLPPHPNIWVQESGRRWSMDGPRVQGLFLRNRIILTSLQPPSLLLLQTPTHLSFTWRSLHIFLIFGLVP